jgi:hypothetical protein
VDDEAPTRLNASIVSNNESAIFEFPENRSSPPPVLRHLGAGAAALSLTAAAGGWTRRTRGKYQPFAAVGSALVGMTGAFYWNDTCLSFTDAQWQLAVKDVADLGFEYLVLLAIAKGGKAFYDTPSCPNRRWPAPTRLARCSRAATNTASNFSSSAIGTPSGIGAHC